MCGASADQLFCRLLLKPTPCDAVPRKIIELSFGEDNSVSKIYNSDKDIEQKINLRLMR